MIRIYSRSECGWGRLKHIVLEKQEWRECGCICLYQKTWTTRESSLESEGPLDVSLDPPTSVGFVSDAGPDLLEVPCWKPMSTIHAREM